MRGEIRSCKIRSLRQSVGAQHVYEEFLVSDKVLYEEMMTNDDNVESSLLTSNLLKICSLYKFCCTCRAGDLDGLNCVVPTSINKYDEVCWGFTSIYTTRVYHSLHRSIMGCSLRVTRAGVTDRKCEC